MDYQALKTEITTDSLGLGYAGKTDLEVANLMTTVPASPSAGRQVERTVIDTWEILEATVPAEYTALTAAEKQRYDMLTGMGKINVKGTNTRAAFLQMFGAGTTTRTNLAALQNRAASRAEVLGFGDVKYWDVAKARAL